MAALNSPEWLYGDISGPGFGRYDPVDELAHAANPSAGDALTETWAFLCYIPDAAIYIQIYIWFHPNLGVVSAGLGGWRGHKNSMLSAELMDFRAFQSSNRLGDGSNCCFENGLSVVMNEPGKVFTVTYSDEARGNSLILIINSASSPVVRQGGHHFDQVTQNSGELFLRGTRYVISGYGMRDRSWGQPRAEAPLSLPPYGWCTGTFGGTKPWSWHVGAFDHPASNSPWSDQFPVPANGPVQSAWLLKDEILSQPKRIVKTTQRDPTDLRPMILKIEFEDDFGQEYNISGRVIASIPWVGWPNMIAYICLTEWRWRDQIGYGDTHEVQWNDFHNFHFGNENTQGAD